VWRNGRAEYPCSLEVSYRVDNHIGRAGFVSLVVESFEVFFQKQLEVDSFIHLLLSTSIEHDSW